MENATLSGALRKKSPRAPSLALDEAIERALKIYEKERRHPAPIDLVAQHLGYKNANNGAALSALASLRYFGLVERQPDGRVAVAKDVESYQYAPDETLRHELSDRWLRSPAIFAELLEKYQEGLPSDGNLRFDLINRGFSPVAAESLIPVFKRSVEFARYYDRPRNESVGAPVMGAAPIAGSESAPSAPVPSAPVSELPMPEGVDRIPVRLSGGRRAWLEIPTPFYAADKERLKSQIDFLLTEEDEAPE